MAEKTVSGVFAMATVNAERIGRIETWMAEHRAEHREQRQETAEQHSLVVQKIDSLRSDLTNHRIQVAEKDAVSKVENVKANANTRTAQATTSAKVAVLWIVLGSAIIVGLKLLGDLVPKLF